jgi:hypothetical protein
VFPWTGGLGHRGSTVAPILTGIERASRIFGRSSAPFLPDASNRFLPDQIQSAALRLANDAHFRNSSLHVIEPGDVQAPAGDTF